MIRRTLDWLAAHENRIVAALIVLLLSAGTVYSIALGDSLRYADEDHYYRIGSNLVAKHLFSLDGATPTSWRPPGYPFVIAAVRLVGLGVPAVRVVNFAFLALAILMLRRLLRAHGASLGGVFAALMVVAYPVLFYAAGTLFPQVLASGLFLSVLVICARDGEWWRDGALAGLVFGALILAVPYFLLALPAVALHPWILKRENRWKRAASLVAVAGCVVCTWTLRNAVVFHRFIPVSSNNGVNFLQGNNERTMEILGGGVAASDIDLSRYSEEARRLYGDDEGAVANYYTAQALRWIRENKWQAFKQYLYKCRYYFSFRNDLSIKSEGARWKDLVMVATYGPLVLLLLLRIALIRRYAPSRLEWMLILIVAANVLTSSVFYPRIRFRLPFDVVLIGLLALFLDRVAKRRLEAASATTQTSPA